MQKCSDQIDLDHICETGRLIYHELYSLPQGDDLQRSAGRDRGVAADGVLRVLHEVEQGRGVQERAQRQMVGRTE